MPVCRDLASASAVALPEIGIALTIVYKRIALPQEAKAPLIWVGDGIETLIIFLLRLDLALAVTALRPIFRIAAAYFVGSQTLGCAQTTYLTTGRGVLIVGAIHGGAGGKPCRHYNRHQPDMSECA